MQAQFYLKISSTGVGISAGAVQPFQPVTASRGLRRLFAGDEQSLCGGCLEQRVGSEAVVGRGACAAPTGCAESWEMLSLPAVVTAGRPGLSEYTS